MVAEIKIGNLTLRQPYAALLPPLSTAEKEALKASIELEGIREPIVIDELGQVLDGHHRLACDPNAPFRVVDGLTDAEKKAYVFQANFARRNMSPDQKRELLKQMKAIAKALRDEDVVRNTQARIAALLGVSRETVSDWLQANISFGNTTKANTPDSRVKVPPKAKPVIVARLDAGETQEQVAADYGVKQSRISQLASSERKTQRKKQEREELVKEIGNLGIEHGDFKELSNSIPDDSIDLILTDPPYDKDSVDLYGDLAQLAARVLRPGGWCLAYSGQTWLPNVLAEMAKHLTYGWLFAIRHSGGNLRYRKLKLQSEWKPVLGFYKPPLDVWWAWFPDLVSGGKEKDEHEWQQSLLEAKHYVEALCPKPGIVFDPMVGSGTVCIAAAQTGRQYIGHEKNEDTCNAARARIHEALKAGRDTRVQ